jgi:ABC-type transporter Mla subunit MlaD
MATTKNTTTKKASASTEIVLGQAAQQIAKAVSELNAATSTVGQLVTQAEELTLQVANKESQIADLEVQYAEKARQAEVEFDLNVKANAERVVTEWLRNHPKKFKHTSLGLIPVADLDPIQSVDLKSIEPKVTKVCIK